eukprot:CAMPEP_0170365306 /NCGR_PEP_ID=MMETSP0117_2-20130122/5832_1 /TAXON_ID=400756 /ORGANISM="Durinskia baltica, Strain CSIRO CS-38" /LENGTH=1058 /DNA_ID=CAMNT_0010619855 /DNA_START=84 /DNA_END=3260 /DNA_ORIENTATION=-
MIFSADEKKRKNEKKVESPSHANNDISAESSISCKKQKTCESHSLNTNVSVLNSLKWEPHRCIRELLLNCIDEDPTASVEKKQDNTWVLKNTVKANKNTLRKESFIYSSDKQKLENRLKNGKFGYGLKDAVVLLTAHGFDYFAQSSNGSFTARVDESGGVWVDINSENGISDQVEQTISIGNNCRFSSEDLEEQIELAKHSCLAFRIRGPFKNYEVVHVSDDENEPIGTIYMPPANDHHSSSELFVHGCAYSFGGDKSRPPLALVYDLHIDKSDIKGRDRVGLPRNWEPALKKLIKYSPTTVLNRLIELRSSNHGVNYYEFDNNQHINNCLNHQITLKEIDYRRKIAAAERAKERLIEAEVNKAARTKERENIEAIRDAAKATDTATATTLALYDKLREESIEEESTANVEVEQAIATIEALEAPLQIYPTVLMFKGEKVVNDGKVEEICINNTNDKKWKEGKIPTSEEHHLMTECVPPIDRAFTHRFRQLRRLLYVMGLQDIITINSLDPDSSVATLVALRDSSLHVSFRENVLDSDTNVLQAAIRELSAAGLFTGLIGCTLDEALTRVCNLMLELTPEQPAELKSRSSELVPKYLGKVHSPMKRFCPLLIATEWDTKCGGISSFNIQLAKGLAAEMLTISDRIVVFIMVLGTDKTDADTLKEWENAASIGIKIVQGSLCNGVYTPCLTSGECARITHIVGHAHITGAEASLIRNLQQFKHAKLWQINHVLPLEADTLKESGTAQSRVDSSHKKEELLKELNANADHVFSVGSMMYEHFDKVLHTVRPLVTNHTKLILPLNPDFLENPTRKTSFPSSNGTIEILYFGRTESVYFLKGMDIAQRAVEKANRDANFEKSRRRIKLTIRGTKTGMEAETMRKLIALQQAESRDFAPYLACFASPHEVMLDLQQTHIVIMPSRNEPFGLVAMEAIACRVPVLVSNNSGVARLLTEHDMDSMCVKTSVHRPDEAASSALAADVDAWSDALLGLIHEGDRAFTRAKYLARTLQESINPPYRDIIKLGTETCAPSTSSVTPVATFKSKKQNSYSCAAAESKSDS